MAGARGGATRAAGRVLLFALAVFLVITLTWTPKVAGDASSSPAAVVASSSSVADKHQAGPGEDAHAHDEAMDTHVHAHAHGHIHGHEEHSHAAQASSTSMQKDHEHTHSHSHSHEEHSREQQQPSHSHGLHHHDDDEGHSHGHNHGHGHGHGHGHDNQGGKSLQNFLQRGLAYAHGELAHHSLATKAIGATLLVTFGGNAVILLFLKLELSKSQLNVMVAFAVGGLLGDVFLHLLPHALESHGQHGHAQDHGHGHSHGDDAHGHEEPGHEHDLTVGLAVLAGILCFFVVEKLLRVAGGSGSHGHAHHSHDDLVARKKKDDDADLGAENASSAGAAAAHGPPLILGLRPGAILNMVADTVHNFTDGMALAAAFQASDAIGLTMTIAVLVHEVPHEVGDFSVLVSQGLSKWGALRAQFVSALGALAGCGFGLAVSSSQPAAILSFTAGGFIYIALVSIVPELLEEPATVSNTILQTLAACCGIYMMIVIAELEAASHAH